nr:DNA alkylation repair protein [Stagnihabitans tardus]
MAQLHALSNPEKAAEMAAYHKTARTCFGVTVPQITELAQTWREGLSTEARVALAAGLWDSNIHEARVAAAKLLTQARIKEDEQVWRLIASWVPQFDGWALADHACDAGERRLVADPSRIDEVETWTTSEHMWTRRAALVITLPWTKQNFPKEADLAIRDRVLGWAATYVSDPDWFIQKAVAWWLRDLSKHDAARTRAFLEGPGQGLKPWAQREAAKHLEAGAAAPAPPP